MPRENMEHGKLLLTADLLQVDGVFRQQPLRSDVGTYGLLKLRFAPIEDLMNTLDRVASREIAA